MADKLVHVNSRVPVRGIKEPFIGIRRNVRMSISDIGICLSKGASVVEVLADGSMKKLTVKNYRDGISEEIKNEVKEEQVIVSGSTKENSEESEKLNEVEPPEGVTAEDIPTNEKGEPEFNPIDASDIDINKEETADTEEGENNTVEDTEEQSEVSEDIPDVTYDTVENFTKAQLKVFANAYDIDIEGKNKTGIIEAIKEALAE